MLKLDRDIALMALDLAERSNESLQERLHAIMDRLLGIGEPELAHEVQDMADNIEFEAFDAGFITGWRVHEDPGLLVFDRKKPTPDAINSNPEG